MSWNSVKIALRPVMMMILEARRGKNKTYKKLKSSFIGGKIILKP
jgi:hypothetical protein